MMFQSNMVIDRMCHAHLSLIFEILHYTWMNSQARSKEMGNMDVKTEKHAEG